MKILVTGAAGFIGSNLSERLIDEGHEVIGIDAFTPYYSRVLKELNAQDIEKKGVKLYELDLVKDDISGLVKDIDIVYHLAAQPGISDTSPFEDYLNNNIIATQNLLKSVEKVPTLKFFVNISTSSVYGLDASKSEDEACEPASYYGVTKLAAEQLVLAKQREEVFQSCSLRLFSVYGERERPDKLYPRVFRSIFTDYKFPYFEGSEYHIRSYTYVGDVIDAFILVLNNLEKSNGKIFNIGLDNSITTGNALKIIEKVMGKPVKYERKPRRTGDQEKTVANIAKAREVLGYEPKTAPAEGFKRYGEWYQHKILPLIKDGKL
ncbi:hypothetical protein A2V49_02795 [candidate division WWE3 bacterium RBG_19FT_COMBO_34_6]|uniref:NAD-dependent epimerase/dehydratase domain-containing protein n=1 Tax=candidate division WWE3 bacterium RBG_19FT_COMBO_34_6 TaxID=1802612 RepID=A0A1F4UN96_UNCKA|nr:MAG: hypothetical protein A2V49_02795 [candidate division WWE3 bacterium RBG_19FT_COMBO_34_6]